LSQGLAVGKTRVIIRLVGYASSRTQILGSLAVRKVGTNGVVPPSFPLTCVPSNTVTLTKQSNGEYRSVATCTAAAVGRARVVVTITDALGPAVTALSAPVNVTDTPMVG
jgi:hypothetical protein